MQLEAIHNIEEKLYKVPYTKKTCRWASFFFVFVIFLVNKSTCSGSNLTDISSLISTLVKTDFSAALDSPAPSILSDEALAAASLGLIPRVVAQQQGGTPRLNNLFLANRQVSPSPRPAASNK